MATDRTGIDYSMGEPVNRDEDSGIRYGVISQNEVLQAWADESEPVYPDLECPECQANINEDELPYTCTCGEELDEMMLDYLEPIGFELNDGEYAAQADSYGDIFVLRSEFFTYAQFCSPCAPGACHLENPLDHRAENNQCYCFGHDWFDSGVASYPVYSTKTGERVYPDVHTLAKACNRGEIKPTDYPDNIQVLVDAELQRIQK